MKGEEEGLEMEKVRDTILTPQRIIQIVGGDCAITPTCSFLSLWCVQLLVFQFHILC